MSEDLEALRTFIEASVDPPESWEIANKIAPGLSDSRTPTEQQTKLIGEGMGMSRDNGEWWKNASADAVSKLIQVGCKNGLTVAQAIEIIEGGVSIGCSEYGG
jgi:hypothetical protein